MRRNLSLISLVIFLASCGTSGPQPNTPATTDAVRAFYVGLAALQAGDDVRATEELTKATQLAPDEPAAWANLGILQMRHRDYEASSKSLERARGLADKDPKIYETIALLEKQRGNFDASQAILQKAIDLDPNNVKVIYALAKEKERQTDDRAARELYERILRARPDNLEVQLEALRLAAKQNDTAALEQIAADIGRPELPWEPMVQTQLDALHSAVSADDAREVVTQVSFLRNMLLRDPRFRASVDEVKYSDTTIGEPFTRPLFLKVPSSSPAPADTALTFEPRTTGGRALWAKVLYLNGDSPPSVVSGTGTETRIGGTTIPFSVSNASGFASFDFDYDFKNDIALAGGNGFRLFRQVGDSFSDVTPQTKLPSEIINGNYAGVWVLDIESDGDLDLVLGRESGSPVVLQNNSDGTFSAVEKFAEANSVRELLWFDVDEDGDADVVSTDKNEYVRYFSNERGGKFRAQEELHKAYGQASAMAIGDLYNDGKLDLVVIYDAGESPPQFMSGAAGRAFQPAFIMRAPQNFCTVLETTKETRAANGTVIETHTNRFSNNCNLEVADLDNNGASDLLLSNSAETIVYIAEIDGRFSQLSTRIRGNVSEIADLDGDGRLDLIGTADGQVMTFINKGTKDYNWQTVRPRAAKTTGDQRVNSFGIGGEFELRSGLLLQKRLITEPIVHFGLGEYPNADVLRVVWQNGSVQAEFDLKPNQTIAAEQRLKGSCPHLFAYDGESFKLVKDAPPWSPALGLKINAQDIFGVLSTEEWFKIAGEALKPTKENFYELRITGEYWESFYIDHYSLLVVDHPEGTEVFTDERFAIPPAPLEVFTTGQTREFVSAKNDKGEDVSALVRTLDEKYLDGFERGTFQGVAKDHYVELELPADAPADKRIAIVADGWVHPTDASINVQLGQSSKEKPRSLSLEVKDAKGVWRVAKENLGFPAGKMKTVLIDLPPGARAARLRTNMEIFWDKLAWAVYEDGGQNKTTRLELATSDLRYRGFSVIEKADDSSPEKPVYDRLLTTSQRWRDMEGYFTRFGDVRELLAGTDNRFVLINAGDELVLKFAALPPPAAGYKRDFVLIGNGWIKDGDLNSVFSKTLIPLPTHESNDYSRPPTTLENDPVYRKHRSDWLNFHTRYVSPDRFRNALR
jgi:Tfp pilus assembly protein PilF